MFRSPAALFRYSLVIHLPGHPVAVLRYAILLSFVSHFVAADSLGQAGYWGLEGGNVPPGAPDEAAVTDLNSDQTSPVFSIESITHDS